MVTEVPAAKFTFQVYELEVVLDWRVKRAAADG